MLKLVNDRQRARMAFLTQPVNKENEQRDQTRHRSPEGKSIYGLPKHRHDKYGLR